MHGHARGSESSAPKSGATGSRVRPLGRLLRGARDATQETALSGGPAPEHVAPTRPRTVQGLGKSSGSRNQARRPSEASPPRAFHSIVEKLLPGGAELTNFGSTSRSGRARSLPPTARGNALVDRFAVRRHGRAQDRLFEFCEEGSYYVRAGALHRSARSIRRTPPAGTVNDHLRCGPGAGNARQASDGRFPPILPRLRCDGAGGGAVLIATPLPKKHKPAPARMSRLHYLEAHGNLGRCHPTGRSECSPLTLLLLKACRSSRRVSRSA